MSTDRTAGTVEGRRLDADAAGWRRWGPYLSERAWGTVREDYSPGGTAWEYLPHEQARSRAYRWNEDGLGGVCDDHQRLCLAFAFWNGRDPILKERVFGLTGNEGNHGEDAKEYWWYLDSTPTHSWMTWRYAYPQAAFPYEDLVRTNAARGRDQPEYELVDTGVLDEDRYWDIRVDYAKAAPDDLCVRLTATNRGPEAAELHVLPTLWFRNRWSWREVPRPVITAEGATLTAEDAPDGVGRMVLTGDGAPTALVCDNESNPRLWGGDPHPHGKDGVNDHVVHGAPTLAPDGRGTKAALWYRVTVPAGGTAEIRLRLAPEARGLDGDWADAMTHRLAEADEFYAGIAPRATPEEYRVMRQAFAGMMWAKQYYAFDVEHWLDGDPLQPPPPAGRRRGRNADWRHVVAADVISMPDPWEYPWFAAWDLAFHCVAIAHVDPGFAKAQLELMLRERYMHPNGQLAAYEWAFGDVNPPVHAWAALRVFDIDGGRDTGFLERVFHKLLINFTWWVNRKDTEGNNLFEGGFLGMDNIGPFDRSAPLPGDVFLEQSDGTGWMATYCLHLLEMSLVLAAEDADYADMAMKFFQHSVLIAGAIVRLGLWDEEDGFFYDRLKQRWGTGELPVRVRSMVGVVPLFAVAVPVREGITRSIDPLRRDALGFLARHADALGSVQVDADDPRRSIVAIADEDRLRRILRRLFDESEFLSPHGLRSLSAAHREVYELWMDGRHLGSVRYEPAESASGMFGGNSNWRGPVWFPVNYLLIESLLRYHRHHGDGFTVEYPTGSGRQRTLRECARDLQHRLVSTFLPGPDGRRPVFGDATRFHTDPVFRDSILFYEYFHGDDGAGIGASHQTGWTGLVADMIVRLSNARAAGEPGV